MFPGYIYVEMTDKAVNNGAVLMMIAGTTNVINFIGGRRPEPIREAEVRRLLERSTNSSSVMRKWLSRS